MYIIKLTLRVVLDIIRLPYDCTWLLLPVSAGLPPLLLLLLLEAPEAFRAERFRLAFMETLALATPLLPNVVVVVMALVEAGIGALPLRWRPPLDITLLEDDDATPVKAPALAYRWWETAAPPLPWTETGRGAEESPSPAAARRRESSTGEPADVNSYVD